MALGSTGGAEAVRFPRLGLHEGEAKGVGTGKETVAYILDQLAPLPVRARTMFGEYGLYCDEKIVALICDDTLFVKPTAIAAQFFDEPELAPPYPGAKDAYVVSGDRLEHREWLQDLIVQTAAALPVVKKRPRKASDRRGRSQSTPR